MKKLFNRIFKYFAEGLLIVLPFICTVFVIVYSLIKFQQFINILINYIPFLSLLPNLPGASLLLVLCSITFAGYMSSNVIIRYFLDFIERILLEIPILGLIYSYSKESASSFLGKFDTPVLVTINKESQIEKLGFLTKKNLKKLNAKSKVSVYCPSSFGFAGETVIVNLDCIKILEGISSTDAFRFALTGGLAEIKQPLVVRK